MSKPWPHLVKGAFRHFHRQFVSAMTTEGTWPTVLNPLLYITFGYIITRSYIERRCHAQFTTLVSKTPLARALRFHRPSDNAKVKT
jgi:hypothetical protein